MDPSKYMIDWLIDLSRVGRLGRVKDGEGEMSSRLRRRLRADAWSRWLWHLHNMLTKYLQVQMLYRSPCTFNPKIQSPAQRHFWDKINPKRHFWVQNCFLNSAQLWWQWLMIMETKIWYLHCIVEPQSPSGAWPRQSKPLPVKVLNEKFSSCSEMEREGKGGIHSAPYLQFLIVQII